jgi:hypothetical protein
MQKRRPLVFAPEKQGSEFREADISIITLNGSHRDVIAKL